MADKSFIDGISQILENRNIISCKRMKNLKQEFENNSENSFEYFLINENFVSRYDMLQALSEYYKVPSIDVRAIFFDQHLIQMFPLKLMKREEFIPYKRDTNSLYVVASNPANTNLKVIINEYVSYHIILLVGITTDIKNAIEEFDTVSPTEEDHIDDIDFRNQYDGE